MSSLEGCRFLYELLWDFSLLVVFYLFVWGFFGLFVWGGEGYAFFVVVLFGFFVSFII